MRVLVEGLRLEGPTRGPLARGLDLRIEVGRALLVTGGSGTGKTSLLKALAGTMPPLGGRVIRDSPLRVGLSLARGGLLVNTALRQNLTLPLRFQGLRREEAEARAEAAMAQLGIGSVGDLRPHALSDRQRKLGSLARVLAFDPDLVLLDEPLEGLDARDLPKVASLLAAWASHPAKALVVATERPEDHADLGAQRLDLEDEGEGP
ncbi:MAG TPA: energy-coupling factor ABC transporter ATP-binding protein [Holophagaceae bacterium]|nr:energy-coupling factor ABC transporter ATP-binding protein [Holophagaceae bacterium]